MSNYADDLDRFEAINHAMAVGYDLGCAHTHQAHEASERELFREAVRVVRLAATLPARDRAADAARGARRDTRWTA